MNSIVNKIEQFNRWYDNLVEPYRFIGALLFTSPVWIQGFCGYTLLAVLSSVVYMFGWLFVRTRKYET